MAVNKVEICGVNTAKLPLLTQDEKKKLFEEMQQGSTEARERLIYGNLRLVLSVIQRFSGHNDNPDDLFQVGCIGLIKAIDNFDTTLGVQFSTYAVPMVLGELRRYVRDTTSSIRVSRSVRDMAYKVIYAKEEFVKRFDREPKVQELSEITGISPEEITSCLDAIATPVSLYEPVYQEGQDTLYLMDQVSDRKNKEEDWVENIALFDAMKRLDERELNIIKLRFFEGKTQMEVAVEVAISQAQVSRLEKNALKSMRKYLK